MFCSYDLYIYGGFADPYGTSAEVSAELSGKFIDLSNLYARIVPAVHFYISYKNF